MRSVLHDGADLCVLSSVQGGSQGVITFQSWLNQPILDRPATRVRGFADGVFAAKGIDELHVVPRRNHWYHSPEMVEVKRIAREFAEQRRVITYGSSMGGYGAALMSAHLGVPAVALAPQFTLDRGVAPWEPRWRDELEEMGTFDTSAMTRDGLASGYLFYDPFTNLDAKQARLFRGQSNFTFVPCPFSGHATSAMVNRTYSLRRLVLEILDGSFTTRSFIAARRSSDRKNDDLYVSMLYVQATARKKTAVAEWAANRIEPRRDQLGIKPLSTLFTFEMRRGRKDLAEGWAKAVSQLTPATSSECFMAARVATQANFQDDAARILRHGLDIDPTNNALKKALAALT